jgi:hypothetical protein
VSKPISHTLHSSRQILVILDALDAIDREATVNFVVSLQKPDGSVAGDEWGEIDTRFTYCALNCLALLDRSECLFSPILRFTMPAPHSLAVWIASTRKDACALFCLAKILMVALDAFQELRAML